VQAALVARWMLVGFIHGVMNTDNVTISGETIDYGPCAFMDAYDAGKVYSSIDQTGRYAYNQQPGIGLWNLTRFAETLLPLLAEGEDAAVESAQDALSAYSPRFQKHYHEGLCHKLGLTAVNEANAALAAGLLESMAANGADFTLTFRHLSELSRDDLGNDTTVSSLFGAPEAFDAWARGWREQLAREDRDDTTRRREMRAINPAFIPRNHRIQQAIHAATHEQNLQPLDNLLSVTSRPFDDHPELADYALPPEPHEVVQRTFCGT